VLALASLTGALVHAADEGNSAHPAVRHVVGAAENWIDHNADSDESAYSRLDQINTQNVARLGLAWRLDLPGETSLEATPLAIDGSLYFTGTSATVYALDSASGKLLWTYAPETWKFNPAKMRLSLPANRGVAYADGRIYSAALDGRLFALDAKTGKLLWSVETVARDSVAVITGAPRTFDGKVIIGNAGADFGSRGYVTAYDGATGKLIWRFYTAPDAPEQNKGDAAMERAAATWNGEYWKTGTGGAVWDNITFDSELDRIYIGTGNAGPYDPDLRSPGGGDNLYTASIVALDAETGKYVWHYQVNPRDSWDYDCTQQMTLGDLTINGQHRKVLMQAPKNGFFYVLDRQTGKVISAQKLGKVTWADRIDLDTGRPVEAKNIRYERGEVLIWPASVGAHSWMSMSFDPQTQLVYIPYMQVGIRFVKGRPPLGEIYFGGLGITAYKADSADGKGTLIAWDPVNQRVVWKAPLDTIWNGGAMATAGGLVFQGGADGTLSAYRASTGQRIWRYDAGMGIIAPPITYSVAGKQFISILVGYGGTASAWGDLMNVGWKFTGPRRLLTFALDGKASLPAAPARDMTVHAIDDPSLKLDPADVAAGHALFMSCGLCHGRNLVSPGGPAADLRESQIASQPDSLWRVVHDGTLLPNGMPSFPALSWPQLMQIYAYIRAGAREALAAQGQAASAHDQGH
jgi:quinohemoprotein ethanol dehydrogenase